MEERDITMELHNAFRRMAKYGTEEQIANMEERHPFVSQEALFLYFLVASMPFKTTKSMMKALGISEPAASFLFVNMVATISVPDLREEFMEV